MPATTSNTTNAGNGEKGWAMSSTYTHTFFGLVDGERRSACVVTVKDGTIIRSNALQCTDVDGTPAYEARFFASRPSFQTGHELESGTDGYWRFLGVK